MDKNVSYVNFTTIEMYRGNQSIFIAADVEHYPVVYFICRWECRTYFTEIVKIGVFHNLEPSDQSRLTVGVLLPELAQGFTGDNVHRTILSRIEI